MELIAWILAAVVFWFVVSDDWDDLRDFLVWFSITVALIALEYVGLWIMTL